eukprot:SAG11_NODE_2301_length_3548_cov_5.628298_3_plen_133_part_00
MGEVTQSAHLIVTIRVVKSSESSKCAKDGSGGLAQANSEVESTLQMVDMAGSERAQRPDRCFAAFANVIRALVHGSKFVPWRDSPLPHLLRISLGQRVLNAAMIANFGPDESNYHETLRTLQMAKWVGRVGS